MCVCMLSRLMVVLSSKYITIESVGRGFSGVV